MKAFIRPVRDVFFCQNKQQNVTLVPMLLRGNVCGMKSGVKAPTQEHGSQEDKPRAGFVTKRQPTGRGLYICSLSLWEDFYLLPLPVGEGRGEGVLAI